LALAESVLRAPPAADPVPVVASGAAPALDPGRPIVALVWNVQFCAGRARHFFYDGGPDVTVPIGEQVATLDRIGAALVREGADLVLLQEVDRGSDRTNRVDQLEELLRRCPYPRAASAPYHRNRYVPHPPHRHLGRMDMHLVVLSRLAIGRAVRHALPALREGWLRQQFNLRRAVLEAAVPLADGRDLRVLNVHLSAFSGGDGTLPAQLARVEALLAEGTALCGGDFNALPPEDDPSRLGADRVHFDEHALRPLYERYTSAVPAEAHADEPERWRTWMPPGSSVADRALDHVFVTPEVEVLDVAVLSGLADASDHLPIRLELRVR
jgi:endonuclease/exonuclease/phosphatase family metal-dependent hydrolase